MVACERHDKTSSIRLACELMMLPRLCLPGTARRRARRLDLPAKTIADTGSNAIRRRSPVGSRVPLPWPEVVIVHSNSSSKARPLSAPTKCSGNQRKSSRGRVEVDVWFGCVSRLIGLFG